MNALLRSADVFLGPRARTGWAHLVFGGAMLMPYFLVSSVLVGPLLGEDELFGSLAAVLTTFAVALPIVAVSALLPLSRPLSLGLLHALHGIPDTELASGPARSTGARLRTAAWCTLHFAVGGVISGMSLAVPPFAFSLVLLPFSEQLRNHYLVRFASFDGPAQWILLPLSGVALLIALAGIAVSTAELLGRAARVLLGPTPSDRLAAAEQRATVLAQRNRVARELHDSVGHALSAVSLQASAARRVLDADPAFARQALAAIEETARRTVGELDAVLGLLRQDDDEDRAAALPLGPTLAELDELLIRTRAAGVTIDPSVSGELGALPDAVSREAYRIVQEGLSNALRHAGQVPVRLRIAVEEEELEITMENPVPARDRARDEGGGRGLRGIAERATLLHGSARAGEDDGVWRLAVRLPAGGAR
ncbi:sensor histidine kinase [Streptomyces sp. NPDC001922]|uniref:sensor histidine kinase n=1 Tax=Streptomyces sp. NPDC001922 TaxID=3364624 RepID=UPI0036D1890C